MSNEQRSSGLVGSVNPIHPPARNSLSDLVRRCARSFRPGARNPPAEQYAKLGRNVATLSLADLHDVAKATFAELMKVKGRAARSDPVRLFVVTASAVVREQRLSSAAANRDAEQREAQPLSTAHRVAALVQELPDDRRLMLLLHVREGLDYREIGRLLGLKPPHVLRELAKAYSALSRRAFGGRTMHGGATTTTPSN